jgi:hypothetical protein
MAQFPVALLDDADELDADVSVVLAGACGLRAGNGR